MQIDMFTHLPKAVHKSLFSGCVGQCVQLRFDVSRFRPPVNHEHWEIFRFSEVGLPHRIVLTIKCALSVLAAMKIRRKENFPPFVPRANLLQGQEHQCLRNNLISVAEEVP